MPASKPHRYRGLKACLCLIFSISQVGLLLHFYSPDMSFHLFLLRHAETEPQQSGQSDFDRELLPKGISQIGHLTQHLSKIAFHPDTIICSPARRAKTTVTELLTTLNIESDNILFEPSVYSGEANDLLDLIHETDDTLQSLLIAGHNPALSNLASLLAKGFAEGLRPCDLVWIEFNESHWSAVNKNTGTLKRLIHATPLKKENE
jgi:phosphohistidine phosphatase